MNTIIDVVAKVLAAVLLFLFCAAVALVVFFRVIERPTEYLGERRIGWHTPTWARPLAKQVKLTPACGYDAWHRDCAYPGIGRLGLVDDPDMDKHEGIVLADGDGTPVIDIQPDGGGLEGELDRKALDSKIAGKTRAHGKGK